MSADQIANVLVYGGILFGVVCWVWLGIDCELQTRRDHARALELEALKAAGVKAPLDVRA